mgnify:CR=1 FL=1
MELKIRKRKIVLVGTGFVGMSFAYSLLSEKGINELILIDMNKEKAVGEQMDLSDGLPYADSKMTIRAGDYAECKDADIVVITAGAAQKPGQTRLELVTINAKITKDVATQIKNSGFDGIMVVANNPVDIMTYVAYKASGLPKEHVIGSGTILDTARLRYNISKHLGIAPSNVHAYIMGEHGDTEFPVWSHANIGGVTIAEWVKAHPEIKEDKLVKMFEDVRDAAYEIIKLKGATFYGIATALARISKAILNDENAVLPLSVYMDGQYGLNDIYIGTPAVINRNGIQNILEIPLTDHEEESMQKSASQLKKVLTDAFAKNDIETRQ